MVDPLNTLLLKYARIQDIPLRELEGAGWTREALSPEAGGGYRLVLLGKEGQDITVKNPVFDTLEWRVTRGELGFGRLERNRFTKVAHSLNNLDGETELNWEESLNNDDHWLSQGFPHFIKPFRQYMGSVFNDDTQYILSRLIENTVITCDLTSFQYYRAVIDILGTDAELPTKDKVEAAYNELEKIRAKYTDLHAQRKYFDSKENQKWFKIEDIKSAIGLEKDVSLDIVLSHLDPVLHPYLLKEDVTIMDIFLNILPNFLKSEGYSRIAEEVKKLKTIDEWRTYFASVSTDRLPSYQREQELRQAMREATLDTKKELSRGLKEVAEAKKQERKLVEGICAFLTPYEKIGFWYNAKIKEIQNTLAWKTIQQEEVLILDGKSNNEEDRDPGKLVGDCTLGRPLPFYRPDTHNIKVRSPQRGVIGSIYLLETHPEQSPEEKVWHLEALQIPYRCDWERSIETLIETLGSAAQKAGVNYITVNQEGVGEGDTPDQPAPLISNFDYIQTAVVAYLKKVGLGDTMIVFPTNIRKYSTSFQGAEYEHQRILWKRDKE